MSYYREKNLERLCSRIEQLEIEVAENTVTGNINDENPGNEKKKLEI